MKHTHCGEGYLESFVLKNALDSCILARWRELRLEDYTERAVAHDFTLSVGKFSCFTGDTILHLLADNFYAAC